MILIDKLDSAQDRSWYAAAAVEYGWSRNVLLNMIMNRSMERTGAAPSNFSRSLSPMDSELAQQVAKDPYAFEFLERTLTERIVDTLRELGPGFAFVGR